jgi:hypothetical protein
MSNDESIANFLLTTDIRGAKETGGKTMPFGLILTAYRGADTLHPAGQLFDVDTMPCRAIPKKKKKKFNLDAVVIITVLYIRRMANLPHLTKSKMLFV